MKLSAIITDYRARMQISQREFSRRCGLSNSYISFLENEINPKTGRPMTVTIEQYKKIANGMGITLQSLWEMLDKDSPVDLYVSVPVSNELTEEEKVFLRAFRAADERARSDALKTLLDHPTENEVQND